MHSNSPLIGQAIPRKEGRDKLTGRLDKTVFVKSDGRAKYGDVVAVVDEVRAAGVDQLGLLTERFQDQRKTPPPPIR